MQFNQGVMPRVVLADDCPDVLSHTRLLLEGEFDVVACAANGAELVRLVGEHKPDVAITDVSMPCQGGLDAARQIRQEDLCRLVMLSVYNDPVVISAAVSAGAAAYVLKQDAGEELIAAVWAVLGGKFYLSAGARVKLK